MKYLTNAETKSVNGGCDHCPKNKAKEKAKDVLKPQPEKEIPFISPEE